MQNDRARYRLTHCATPSELAEFGRLNGVRGSWPGLVTGSRPASAGAGDCRPNLISQNRTYGPRAAFSDKAVFRPPPLSHAPMAPSGHFDRAVILLLLARTVVDVDAATVSRASVVKSIQVPFALDKIDAGFYQQCARCRVQVPRGELAERHRIHRILLVMKTLDFDQSGVTVELRRS